MANSTNGAGAFVALTLEDAVKAGIGGAGLGTVGTVALTHTPLTVALGFGASFIVSLLLSLISQPIGDKSTNHVLHAIEAGGQQLLEQVVADLAAQAPQQSQAPVSAATATTVAPPPAWAVPTPPAGVQSSTSVSGS